MISDTRNKTLAGDKRNRKRKTPTRRPTAGSADIQFNVISHGDMAVSLSLVTMRILDHFLELLIVYDDDDNVDNVDDDDNVDNVDNADNHPHKYILE